MMLGAMNRLLCLLALLLLLLPLQAGAVTYANTTTVFNWIDASSHTKIGYNTSPYKFNGLAGCGTTPPTLDDTISDEIPIGFSFLYAGVDFTTLRVMANGRVQFNNNTTCGYGSPVQQLPYPNSSLNYTMRIYGNDLDPTLKSDQPSYNTPCVSNATCYVSYATLGTAPYRSFVVTWNNVPEWTTGGNPQGSYNLQLILQENGEFIYQYGTDVPGPSANLGQVGWQVDSGDYETPQVGFPANNSAIKFFIPRPVVEYRMEQSSWTAAAGQVIDTSGFGRHGTALGSVQTIANGRVCRAGSVSANASAATISAIDSNIAVPTTVGGAGTITFWYRGNTAWSGTGVVDAQLFDASVANNQWFFLTRRNNGNLRFAITDAGGTVRSAETAAIAVSANTWKHIAVSWNFNSLAASNSDHLRIYVDGVLQRESAFSTVSSISSQVGTLYIGDNRSSFVGSNGTGNSANGAIDEFRVYNYEGGLALVQRDFKQGGAGCLSHYAIADAGTGVTCQQNTVTVTAHDVNHSNITMPNNTTTIQLSTSSGKGDWALINGYGVLNNGTADDGTATYLFNGEYQAVFGLTHSTAASVSINVTDGQFVESEDPPLVISTCLTNRFNACELSSPRCVPSASSTTYARLNTKLANTAFSLDLVKLKVDGTLETTFAGGVTVDLLANSNNGVALSSNNCPASQTAVIPLGTVAFSSGRSAAAGVTVAANSFSAVSPNYSAYRDVRVRFTCSAAVCGSAMLACSTDNFAVRPIGFVVSSSDANADATGVSTTLTPAIKAGANFTLAAASTPGYNAIPKIDTTKVSAHAGASQIVSPAGNFGNAVAATGIATGTAFTYPEVGYFNFAANGVYDDTFASVDSATSDCTNDFSTTAVNGKFGCKFGNAAVTPFFGRFIPDHFRVLTPVFSPACNAGGFSYMDQPFATGLSATVEAQNSAGLVTMNYNGGFAKGTVSVQMENANNGVPLAVARLGGQGTPAWSAGSYSFAATQFLRLAGGPDGPYDQLDIGLAVADEAALPAASRPNLMVRDMDAANASCTADLTGLSTAATVCSATRVVGGAKVRYGRLWLGNAYGSDRLALSLPYETQYWNGFAFVRNPQDSCTALSAANFGIGNYQGALNAANLPVTAISPGSFVTGAGTIVLAAPNAAGSADLVVRLNPTLGMCPTTWVPAYPAGTPSSADYLRGKWCGASYDKDPVARATFGINKSGRQIYLREGY